MATRIPNNWKLPPELVRLSESDNWDTAVKEWKLDEIEYLEAGEESETCLCTHTPIREVCHISNVINKNEAIVGNCCITRIGGAQFEGVNLLFQGLKRIFTNRSLSANATLINYSYERRILSSDEHEFYLDVWRKRSLTDRQLNWIKSLNEKIVKKLTRSEQTEAIQAVVQKTLQEALDDLKREPHKLADKIIVDYAHEKGILSQNDYEFYTSLFERNVTQPTEKQQKWLDDLNHRMTSRIRLVPVAPAASLTTSTQT